MCYNFGWHTKSNPYEIILEKILRKPRKILHEELKLLLDYDPNSGLFYWKNNQSKKCRKGTVAGSLNPSGYIKITINRISFYAHRLAWLFYYGYLPEKSIDHIDRNRSNNRIDNLREVSQSCNTRNTGNFSHNSSGVKGVRYDSVRNKWRVEIKVNSVNIFLYRTSDFEEAVLHRLAAEQCLNWEGCDSSSPAYNYYNTFIRGCCVILDGVPRLIPMD